MKKLKWFVQKREKLKGFMVEGYIIYDSFYYASECIKKIDDTLGAVVWNDQHDEDKREWELFK